MLRRPGRSDNPRSERRRGAFLPPSGKVDGMVDHDSRGAECRKEDVLLHYFVSALSRAGQLISKDLALAKLSFNPRPPLLAGAELQSYKTLH